MIISMFFMKHMSVANALEIWLLVSEPWTWRIKKKTSHIRMTFWKICCFSSSNPWSHFNILISIPSNSLIHSRQLTYNTMMSHECLGVSNHLHLDCLINSLFWADNKSPTLLIPLWGETTGDCWIPHQRPVMHKVFPYHGVIMSNHNPSSPRS